MRLNRTSLIALVGGGLAAGSLFFAGPAAAHPAAAGHSNANAGVHLDPVPSDDGPLGPTMAAPATQSGSRVGAELPIAPVGTAGPGRIALQPLSQPVAQTSPNPSSTEVGSREWFPE